MSAPPAPARERFPPRARLRRKREFERVFRGGVRRGTSQVRVVISENDFGYSRLGLAVGRRVGGAVVRNRMKRRFREIFRRHRGEFPVPLDVVVIPLAGAERLSFEELREQFLRLVGEYRPRKRKS